MTRATTTSKHTRPHNTRMISVLPSPSHRLDCAQSTLCRDTQPHRLVERHVRACRVCRVCPRRRRCERSPPQQGRVLQDRKMGHIDYRELGRQTPCSSPPATAASPRHRMQQATEPPISIYMCPRHRAWVQGSPTGSPWSASSWYDGIGLGPPVMLPAAHVLDCFHVPYELTIVSVHRTPDRLVEYARSASGRGLRVIVAGSVAQRISVEWSQ